VLTRDTFFTYKIREWVFLLADRRIEPVLRTVVVDPSVFGGPTTYSDIRHKNGYLAKFNKYIQKHKVISFVIYSDEKNHTYFYHFQITSESNEKVVYDVVIKFFTNDPNVKKEETLDNYNLQIFSNSPGFVFQFAYVYNQKGILVDELKSKFTEVALNTPPEKSNPTKAVGYDYTVYFALYYLVLHSYYISMKQIHLMGKKINKFDHSIILSAKDVMDIRSPKEILNFNKITRNIKKTLIDKPKETINDFVNKIDVLKSIKAKGGIKASKANKAKKAIRTVRRKK
jgi:hypothetical protein